MSRTVTVNEQPDAFVESSVAVQSTVVVPIAKMLPEAGTHDTVGVESHVSVAVTVKVTGAPLELVHWRTRFAGHVIAGAVVSAMETVNEQLDAFDEASVAVQFTVVVPIANVLPDAGAQTTLGLASHVSVAVAVNVTGAPLGPVHSLDAFVGHVIVGATVSRTVTVNEHAEEFPVASVAVQFTVVVAIANVAPDAGAHDTMGLGSQLSVAVVVYDTDAPLAPVHSRTKFVEHVMTGGIESMRSRKKTSEAPFVSPVMRFVAMLEKTTNCPLEDTAGSKLFPLACVPIPSTLTRAVADVTPSYTKTSVRALVSPATRFVALLRNVV